MSPDLELLRSPAERLSGLEGRQIFLLGNQWDLLQASRLQFQVKYYYYVLLEETRELSRSCTKAVQIYFVLTHFDCMYTIS